ncbi:MAG: zinc-ribbon and DUF3426 domain-containing protein [Pseudomonadota bacterium]
MSLATRCNHCGTIFKVVQDQLKVSEGWVRCGRCNEVFNALPGLFDLEREPPPQRPATAPPRPEPEPEPEAPASEGGDSTWAPTAPAPIQTSADDFELDLELQVNALTPQSPPPPTPAMDDLLDTTDFELDTAVSLDAAAPESSPVLPPSAPSYAPEFLPSDLPVTDESDALDSRYLMPSATERRAPRRRKGGPDFADAEFPNDVLSSPKDEWMSDFGPSSMACVDEPVHIEPALAQATATTATPEAAQPPVPTSEALTATPEELPSAAFVPEQSLPPPRMRASRPGSRSRKPKAKTPEFMRRARRLAFWRHPGTRAALSLIALGLLLTLALQVAHQFRNVLAAHHPALRPYLVQWCQAMDCRLEPPLRIDSLQVESATLVRTNSEGPDTYRLVVVVHNRAPIGLAWPHVDLTLTDTNGAVVARRAFAPQDAQWLDTSDASAEPSAKPSATPEAAPGQRSTTLQWRLRAPDLKLAGYTAELFYP